MAYRGKRKRKSLYKRKRRWSNSGRRRGSYSKARTWWAKKKLNKRFVKLSSKVGTKIFKVRATDYVTGGHGVHGVVMLGNALSITPNVSVRGWGNYANLFRFYRIRCIKYEVLWWSSPTLARGEATLNNSAITWPFTPKIAYIADPMFSASPTNWAGLNEGWPGMVRTVTQNDSLRSVTYFRPYLMDVATGAAGVQNVPVVASNKWFSTFANGNLVFNLGNVYRAPLIQAAIYPNSTTYTHDLRITIYIDFKGRRNQGQEDQTFTDDNAEDQRLGTLQTGDDDMAEFAGFDVTP